MRRPERLAAAAAALTLAACTTQPLHVHMDSSAVGQYEYLMLALNADTAGREALWQKAQNEPASDDATLHRALLRSVPGHSGADLAAAEADLQNFLAQKSTSRLAPVARARLEDLRGARACRVEVETLKRRLSKVADIERRQDQNRR